MLRSAKTVVVGQGPTATLEVLFRAEYTGMVRLPFTLVGNAAEAEEVVQESFADLSFRLDDRDDPVREPGAYRRTIVVGRCRSLIRRRRLVQQHPPEPPPDLPGSADTLWDVVHGLPEHPPDDFDGWIEANHVIVDDRDETVDGRDAHFRVVRAPEGSEGALCPTAALPCIRVNSVSADAIESRPNDGSRIDGPLPNAYWMIELDEFEPIGIWAYAFDGDIDGWLDEIAPIVDSMTFGEPGPAVEGGTARIPERVTANSSMTVDQTGERDAANPWPLERTGELTGDIVGTSTGTGIASPDGAEITLDWTMTATIDGIGSGTLTLRSYWYRDGDGATLSTDHVTGGTGDFAGWIGYGTGVRTSDDGNTFGVDIELHLAPPTG